MRKSRPGSHIFDSPGTFAAGPVRRGLRAQPTETLRAE